MANLSHDDVLELAKLSRIHLTKDEVNKLQAELSKILEYVEQLGSLKLSDLEPTYQVTGLKNVMRKDVVKDYKVSPEALLQNAPATESGQIKVRRVIE